MTQSYFYRKKKEIIKLFKIISCKIKLKNFICEVKFAKCVRVAHFYVFRPAAREFANYAKVYCSFRRDDARCALKCEA